MTGARRFLVLFCILASIGLACGMSVDLGIAPSPQPVTQLPREEQASTMVAQTLQALTQAAVPPTPTATPTVTNTAVPATLSVSVATACYAGPSNKYGFVFTLQPGNTVPVVGKDTPDNYWIIEVPEYPGTICWLSGQYASLTGDTAGLPSPATPRASNYTLSEPRNLRVSCSAEDSTDDPDTWSGDDSEWFVVLRWKNTDPDQTAVRIYRNGWHVATLGAHANTFSETIFHHKHHGVTYGVQVVNSREVSSIVTVDLHRCK